ncbi:hypothetical protein FE374_11880 [Georgenia yuyongxinii]|uniref:DUF4386 family protein n=1 Tax=Georgenia yuyongxinii TaxID=2589797 RepID=A0A5B8C3M4_9MICO|nr:hypothetical protein [Georgenia yuyongxinii]QDC25213.1 hypothetical protein FE374_11880 [Georgenia yuyongxinii]
MPSRSFAVLAALAGLVSMAVLVTVPSLQCLACETSLGAPDEQIERVFRDWASTFYWGAYAELLAVFLFTWFLAHLVGELRRVAPGQVYATVALLGGGLFAAGVLVQLALTLAATTVAEGSGATVAHLVLAVAYNFAFVYAAPVAALVMATSLAVVRTRWLPRPLGWAGFVAVVVALAWITPGIGAVAGMVWIAALSVCLAVRAVRPSGQRQAAVDAVVME